MRKCLSLLLFTLTLLLGSCRSLITQHYDASSWRWYHKYIGRVKHAVFHTSAKGKKLLLAATEQNVLASLNIRNGQIIWRRVLGDADIVNGLDTASGKYVITLSGGTTLRAWSITNGDLIWETTFPPFASPPTLDVTPIEIHHLKAKMILVYRGLQLYGVSSADGEILWRTNIANASQGGMFSLRRVLTGDDKNSLYGVGFTGTSGFCVWKIHLFTGRLVMKEAATIKASICTDELVVTKHTVVGLDCEGKTIFTGHIGPVNSFSIHRMPIQNVVPDAFGKARLLKSTLEGVFVLRLIDQIVLIKIGKTDHNLKVLEIFERPAVISNTLELLGNKTSVVVVQHVGYVEDCKVALRVVTIEGEKDETFSHVLDLDCERGLVQQAYLSGYVRKDKSCGYRVLLVMEDHSLVFVQNSKILWTREDGLAAIAAVVVEELPAKKVELKHIDVARKHWFKIEQLMAGYKGSGAQDFSHKQGNSGRSKLVQDEHGFRKLMIVLTKGRKLFALHSGSGKIVWSLLIPSFRKSIKKSKTVVLKLLPWFYSAKPAQTQNPMVLVVGNSGSKADGSGILAWVDSYTGTELHSVYLSYAIEDVLPLAKNDLQTEHLYLLMDVKRNIHVFPTLPDRFKLLQGEHLRLIFPVIDVDRSVISGYGFNLSAQMQPSLEIPSSFLFRSKKVWKKDFLPRSERLVATSEIDKVERKNLMLNDHELCGIRKDNLMLVASDSISISKTSGNDSNEETGLALLVMDTMTGEILHNVWHSKAQGPVHMVKDKNWFAYCYFDSQALAYKFSTLEILETDCEEYQNASVVMNTSALNQSRRGSSVLRSEKAVYIPDIKALGFMKGSAKSSRQLLFGALDGQITLSGMDSVNDTIGEGVISKWMRFLGSSSPQLNLTRAGPVEGLRKIVSVPTMSGSLVFAYGIDILLVQTVLHHHTPSYLKGYSICVVLATIGAILFVVFMTQILPRYKRSKKFGKHSDATQ